MARCKTLLHVYYTRDQERDSEQTIETDLRKSIPDRTSADTVSFDSRANLGAIPEAVPPQARIEVGFDDRETDTERIISEISDIEYLKTASTV